MQTLAVKKIVSIMIWTQTVNVRLDDDVGADDDDDEDYDEEDEDDDVQHRLGIK